MSLLKIISLVMNSRVHRALVLIGILAVCGMGVKMGAGTGAFLDEVPIGAFSTMDPSEGFADGWQTVSMAAAWDTTSYELVRTDRGVVVRARSEAGVSALGRRCNVDLTEYPVLEWSWKAEGILEDGKAGVRGRHDFPARIYIDFDYEGLGLYRRLKLLTLRVLGFDSVPTRSLSYAWVNRVPAGTVVRSPYVEWLRQVVVRSGTTDVGTWVTERRNVLKDYWTIFGEDPPPVQGISIMTNSRHTQDTVTAYYGDITFRTALPDSGQGERAERVSLKLEKDKP